MQDGRILEQGSHQALLEKDGSYAHLWRIQQQKREQAEPAVNDEVTG
jgi:ATP-binding cassette subfamily B protein